MLSIGLLNQPNLICLNLNFGQCHKVTDIGLHQLCNGLRVLVNLESLNLILSWCHQITNSGLRELNSTMTYARNLSYLNLDLNMAAISWTEIQNFADRFKKIEFFMKIPARL